MDVAQAVGATDTYDGRSVALADLWNRGVLDVVVANQRGPLLIYKNTVKPGNEWVEFALEGTRAIEVRSAPRSLFTGAASSSCSRFLAEAGLRRRTIAGCTLDSV